MRVPGLLSACLVATTLVACSGDPAAPAGSRQGGTPTVLATVEARFTPSAITVPVGGTVTWQFQATPYNVSFRQASGAPSDITGANANTSLARSFPVAGAFVYDCTLHRGMTGTVPVGQSSNQPPPPGEPPPGYPDYP